MYPCVVCRTVAISCADIGYAILPCDVNRDAGTQRIGAMFVDYAKHDPVVLTICNVLQHIRAGITVDHKDVHPSVIVVIAESSPAASVYKQPVSATAGYDLTKRMIGKPFEQQIGFSVRVEFKARVVSSVDAAVGYVNILPFIIIQIRKLCIPAPKPFISTLFNCYIFKSSFPGTLQ